MPARLAEFADADAIVVVAGMEGALPSVVGGYVACPVFAVPTSVGYGASFGGLAPLLTMLNSCAANVAVVNIDAGFKAGYLAGLVATRTAVVAHGMTAHHAELLSMQDESSTPLPTLPPRRPDSHKGDYGRVLVLAGSRGWRAPRADASTAFRLLVLSPDCDEWASSTISAKRLPGSSPISFAITGNFCSVVTMIVFPASSASLSWREVVSMFSTTPSVCSNWRIVV